MVRKEKFSLVMKKVLFFLFLIFSVYSYADAGYSYRFYVKIKVKKGYVNGYIYHSSYEKYDQDVLLINYLKKTSFNNKVNLYTDIKTVKIKDFIVDFVIKDSGIILSLNNNLQIEKEETLIYNGDERLIQLNYDEYDLVKSYIPNADFIYNENLSENCTYILLSWNELKNLSIHKSEMENKLNYFSKDLEKYNVDINNYIQAKKNDLLKNNILLISYCSVL